MQMLTEEEVQKKLSEFATAYDDWSLFEQRTVEKAVSVGSLVNDLEGGMGKDAFRSKVLPKVREKCSDAKRLRCQRIARYWPKVYSDKEYQDDPTQETAGRVASRYYQIDHPGNGNQAAADQRKARRLRAEQDAEEARQAKADRDAERRVLDRQRKAAEAMKAAEGVTDDQERADATETEEEVVTARRTTKAEWQAGDGPAIDGGSGADITDGVDAQGGEKGVTDDLDVFIDIAFLGTGKIRLSDFGAWKQGAYTISPVLLLYLGGKVVGKLVECRASQEAACE